MMVFIGSPPYPRGHIRRQIRKVVLQAWHEIPGVEIVTATTKQDERWRKAEKLGQLYNGGKYYILADDDCLPIGSWKIERISEVLDRFRDIAIASAAMPDQTWEEEFHPLHAVGGIRVIRKGVLNFPDDFNGGDSEAYNLHMASGYRSGVLTFVRANHLGHGLSTNWRHESLFS